MQKPSGAVGTHVPLSCNLSIEKYPFKQIIKNCG